MNTISRIQEMPEHEHYAVFANQPVSIDGGNQVELLSYLQFKDEETLKEWISVNSHLPFRVVKMKPIKVKTQVELS
jgi:hypothetical protein